MTKVSIPNLGTVRLARNARCRAQHRERLVGPGRHEDVIRKGKKEKSKKQTPMVHGSGVGAFGATHARLGADSSLFCDGQRIALKFSGGT